MPEQHYSNALKAGQKEYRTCISRGEYPYLSALDDVLPEEQVVSSAALGIMQIPMEFIVGTKTRGRKEAFARNFMPLLEEKSEFAVKWKRLCQSHLEEGIRDPIKVYEYMNRYYVEEGNKRVSVLRFFDAVNVSAVVTRILPERTPENELYFEHLQFYRCSKVNFLEFSKKGSCAALQRMLGKEPDEVWTEEERRKFSSNYSYFRTAYEAKGGKWLNSTVGDAMLACIGVYGYQALCSMGSTELKKAMEKMWEEMTLQQEQTPIEIKTAPAAEVKPGVLASLLAAPKQLKVTFLHDGKPDVSGWTLGHELGRTHLQRVFEGKIQTDARMNVMSADPLEEIEHAIADGADVIFTTSPRMLPASLRAAVDHPEVILLNCSLNTSHRYIRTYYARMFEAKFVIGATAGAMSQSGQVGYVCDYPIYGQIAGINAFALGAQMVNPRATVCLEWSSVGGSAAATKRLLDQGIHLISTQDMAKLSTGARSSFGLSRFTEDGSILLAAPVWNWGAYYEEIIRRILNKTFQKEYETSKKALNYYWGMSAGVVSLDYTDAVPESVRKMAWNLKAGICAGVVHPFLGPIYRQDGSSVGDGQKSLSLEEIINMDYLVENVVGSIPEYQELNTIGKATVDHVGVQPAQIRK